MVTRAEQNRQARNIVRQLEGLGWRVKVTTRRHFMCYSPDGKTLIQFAPGESYKALLNAAERFRRAGVEIKP